MSTPGLSQPGAQAPQAAPNPHAGLMRMIQGLAVGLDSFASSAATQGREGGVEEVQRYQAHQQEMEQNAQASTRQEQRFQTEQKESDLRMKTMNAQLLMNEAAYHHALQMYPAQEKEANLKVLNDATASYKDALQEGYDISDPTQAALWRNMQQSIISIPFSSGQSSSEVLSTVKDAASKDGKDLTDFIPLTNYTDGKHGSGGTVTLIPATSLDQVKATPQQLATGMAQMKATLSTATTALGKDDPDVKALSGKLDMIQGVLDKGGSPSAGDFLRLNRSVLGPLSTRIAAASQTVKLQKEQSEAEKAKTDAIKSAREANPVTAAQDAGLKSAADAKARQPYQVELKQLEAPIAAGVAGNKDARDKIETNYLKPYADKINAVNELKVSLTEAEQGNVAGSRAVLLKLLGLAVPGGGSKRISPEALKDMGAMGSAGQKWFGSIKDVLTGDKWTAGMSADMRAFANDMAAKANQNLRIGIKTTNALYGTNIDADKVLAAANPELDYDQRTNSADQGPGGGGGPTGAPAPLGSKYGPPVSK